MGFLKRRVGCRGPSAATSIDVQIVTRRWNWPLRGRRGGGGGGGLPMTNGAKIWQKRQGGGPWGDGGVDSSG